MSNSSDFETWAMRGAVAIMGGWLTKLVYDRWKRQDKMEEAFKEALDLQRKEFEASLNALTTRFQASIDQLNSTIVGLSQSIGKLDASVAKEYASETDLRESEGRWREALKSCADRCPYRNGVRP